MKTLANRISSSIIQAWIRSRHLFKTFCYPRPNVGKGRFICGTNGLKLRVIRAKGASIILHGNVYLQSALGDRGDVTISLGAGSTFEVNGDFIIGAGVQILVRNNARLTIGGKKNSSGSGITCNTRIMVNQEVVIGADSIIAWDCFITDCDWHQILGKTHTQNVIIGEHVWIAKGATVLKGTEIGSGSIVSAGAVLPGGKFEKNSLIAGNPGKQVRTDIEWTRDMKDSG